MHLELDCFLCGKEISGNNIHFSEEHEPLCDICAEKKDIKDEVHESLKVKFD